MLTDVSRISKQKKSLLSVSSAIDHPKVKATTLLTRFIPCSRPKEFTIPFYFFSDEEKEGYAVYDMFIEIKSEYNRLQKQW